MRDLVDYQEDERTWDFSEFGRHRANQIAPEQSDRPVVEMRVLGMPTNQKTHANLSLGGHL